MPTLGAMLTGGRLAWPDVDGASGMQNREGPFAVKARNATNAGAAAVIIYNNAANATSAAPGMADDGVPNTLLANGCTIVDLVSDIQASAGNHGGFVSGVAQLTDVLIRSRSRGWVRQVGQVGRPTSNL